MPKTSIANKGKVFIFCPMGNGICLCNQNIQPLKKKSLDTKHLDPPNHKVKKELNRLLESGANHHETVSLQEPTISLP